MLDVWSKGVIKDFTKFVEANRNIPFIEDILIDCDQYGLATEDVSRLAFASGNQEHQSELFQAINMLMYASYNMGRHQGVIENVDLRANPESRKALKDHLERAREKFTPVKVIKLEVVTEETKGLWKRRREFVGNIRGTANAIMKTANAEIRRRCSLLSTEARVGVPTDDLSLSAMMGWVRRAESELMRDGQFAGL